MEIDGLDSLNNKIAKMADKYGTSNVSVVVGYEAQYAAKVHEDIEMKWAGRPRQSGIGVYWGPHGQAKFLEAPARQNSDDYARIIKTILERGGTLEEALVAAGTQLQRDSQELVPVEFGNLKASAFTQVERR
jgi:hypothetical protein